jgi:hypothetical protein
MLVHKHILRKRIRTLAVTTFVVGLSFLSMVGFVTAAWLNTKGPEHAELLQTVAMYSNMVAAESEIVIPDKYATLKAEDPRNTDIFLKKVAAVRAFLKRYNAPLAANAEDFVRAAEMYGIDYRLLPSISMIESSGGKVLFRKYNPFGWGKWGYPSFTAAIYDVARGMSNYYAGGLREPERIAYRYNPVTPESWGRKARTFMNQMPAL